MRRVTLKQLRIAAAAGRLGSFTAAGDAVGLTPSAVSMQMKALAEEVGLPLFEFAEGRLLLTKAGEEVLAAAARIEAVLNDCDQAVAGLRDPGRGRVVVGVVSTAKYFAPQALGAFHKAYPRVELKLVIGNRNDIIEGLRQREIDLAIMGRPPEGMEVELVKLADHPHVIIAAPDHPLSAAAPARSVGSRGRDLSGAGAGVGHADADGTDLCQSRGGAASGHGDQQQRDDQAGGNGGVGDRLHLRSHGGP